MTLLTSRIRQNSIVFTPKYDFKISFKTYDKYNLTFVLLFIEFIKLVAKKRYNARQASHLSLFLKLFNDEIPSIVSFRAGFHFIPSTAVGFQHTKK